MQHLKHECSIGDVTLTIPFESCSVAHETKKIEIVKNAGLPGYYRFFCILRPIDREKSAVYQSFVGLKFKL